MTPPGPVLQASSIAATEAAGPASLDGARDQELLATWLGQGADLERATARFSTLAATISSGIAVLTRERVVFANTHAGRLLGVPPDRLPRLSLRSLVPDREARAALRTALQRAWEGRPEDVGPIPVAREDGTRVQLLVALRPLPREVEPTLLVALEEVRAVGAVAGPGHASQEILRVFGLYLAEVASGLRGPLTASLGHLNTLSARPDLPADLREVFALYRDVTEEALERVARALDWGRRLPIMERLDLREVVRTVVASLEQRAYAADVRLDLDLDAVPAVEGNRQQLEFAIEHVLRNACEALAGRVGAVRVGLARDGRRVVLTVRDTGPGIPGDVMPRLFHPVGAASPSAGAGLGLAITHYVVERHHGEIALQSSVTGTLVRLAFDAVDAPGSRPGTAKRALLVDDNVELLEIYRMFLAKRGWTVTCAHDADEGLQLAATAPFDVIVLDVQMPWTSGLELADEFAARYPALLPRVVFHTAYAHEDAVRGAADRHGRPVLEKPCPLPQLLRTLEAFVPPGAAAPAPRRGQAATSPDPPGPS